MKLQRITKDNLILNNTYYHIDTTMDMQLEYFSSVRLKPLIYKGFSKDFNKQEFMFLNEKGRNISIDPIYWGNFDNKGSHFIAGLEIFDNIDMATIYMLHLKKQSNIISKEEIITLDSMITAHADKIVKSL